MFKVIGADGKEYGPISLDQLTEWASQGRVNPQTQVQAPGATDWKPASEIPELQTLLAKLRSAAPPQATAVITPPTTGPQQKGLAITSLVLGIFSVTCLGPLTGIPAIICGHIAHNRARRSPGEYGGSGLAIAGFAMGYASLLVGIFLVAIYSAMLFPALSKAKGRAQEINCVNHMKMIGLAFKTWAIDHNDQFPFNVKTNAGGTLELCAPGPNGFDQNAAAHFLVISNELGTPKILVCPADTRSAALDWEHLQAANVSYQLRSGPSVTDTNPQQTLAVCPIHNSVLLVDGSVQRSSTRSRTRSSTPGQRTLPTQPQ